MKHGIVSALGRDPEMVLDPFAGSGTVMARSRQLGWASCGVEYTQLGCLIASVRLDPPDDLEAALEAVEGVASQPWKDAVLSTSEDLQGWIGAENALKLSRTLKTVKSVDDPRLRRWMQLAASSALRPASRWLPGSIKPQVEKDRDPTDIDDHMVRSARRLVRDAELEPKNPTPVSVIRGSSTFLPLRSESVDAVITSPPYGWMYDYIDVHRLSYLAFGWSTSRDRMIGRKYGIGRDGYRFEPPSSLVPWYQDVFRGEDTAEGRALRQYIQDMRAALAESARCLKEGGVISMAVANSYRQGKEFDLTQALAEILRESSFEAIRISERETSSNRILPSGRDPRTGRFSSAKSAVPAVAEKVILAIKT